MSLPNFELITELQLTARRDFPVADTNILNPLASSALVEGEWLELNADYKLFRGAGVGAAKEGIKPAFPVHTERGRYDTQAVQKVNVIYLHAFEAETVVVGGASTLNIGDALTVQDVTMPDDSVRRGLAARVMTNPTTPTNGAAAVVGYVSKVTGAKVRFIHTGIVKAF